MVTALLQAKAPHDALDGQGNTPMHLASESVSVWGEQWVLSSSKWCVGPA